MSGANSFGVFFVAAMAVTFLASMFTGAGWAWLAFLAAAYCVLKFCNRLDRTSKEEERGKP